MEIQISFLKDKLVEKGLKVTPQRMSILEAVYVLNNHPTAEQVIDYIKPRFPGIASGTVYKVLDTLVKHELVKKVKTEKDVMRYDGIIDNHHHLYCVECDYIVDYNNEALDAILKKYFEDNKIENFIIEDLRLQINGRFIVHHKQ